MNYLQSKSMEQSCWLFEIYKNFKKIGTCLCQFLDVSTLTEDSLTVFPTTWFYHKRSKSLFPILEIAGLETLNDRNNGNGRLCLQALFNLSQSKNCGGRMVVRSKFGSTPFYEHCGFVGQNAGQDGIKYFNPTKRNMDLLFKDSEQTNDFKFIPFETPRSKISKNSVSDKELFHQMLLKSQQLMK